MHFHVSVPRGSSRRSLARSLARSSTGDLDMSALEEFGKQMEEASKNCDTEKLSALAEACGLSMNAERKTCTGECKEMFKFMGEADGCGGLYDQFGLEDIERVCNGADLSEIVADVPKLPITPVATDTTMPTPTSTPESATATNTEALPVNIAELAPETTSGSMAGAVFAAAGAILAMV